MKTVVGVVGQGFVGGALAEVLVERGVRVETYDRDSMRRSYGSVRAGTVRDLVRGMGFSEPRLIFVCVPTPMLPDGGCDTSAVHEVVAEIAGWYPADAHRPTIVLKSTVPPGTTDEWNAKLEKRGSPGRVVFCPEFLREATALEDMRGQKRIVLGGPRPWVNEVKQFFERVFPDATIHKTSAANAELVKYVTNAFLAVKVSFANEVAQLAEALDAAGLNVDYDRVVDIACEDERLGRSHWKVPGPMPADDTGEPARGFGGSCFVKDLNSLMCVARERGVDPKVMAAAWAKNLEVRPGRDWERLAGRAVSAERDPGPARGV